MMSSAASVSGVVSISDFDSTIGVEANAASGTLGSSGNTLFDSGDRDLRLIVGVLSLKLHEGASLTSIRSMVPH